MMELSGRLSFVATRLMDNRRDGIHVTYLAGEDTTMDYKTQRNGCSDREEKSHQAIKTEDEGIMTASTMDEISICFILAIWPIHG